SSLFEPDLTQRHVSLAQETELHPLHVGLVQVCQDQVLLGNPRGIRQDYALYFTVEHNSLRLIKFLPSLLQQLVHTGVAVERAIGRTGRVEEWEEHTIRVGDICLP